MRAVVTMMVLLSGLIGCETKPAQMNPLTTPPSGQGVIEGDNGVFRTSFKTLGVLKYGDVGTGRIEANTLTGFIFAADETHTPTLKLSSPGVRLQLAIYGPKTSTGLWGDALTFVDGTSSVQKSDWSVPKTGTYFALIRSLDRTAIDVRLALDCPKCSDPICDDLSACDLFCPSGLAVSDDGVCLMCECGGSSCPISGCLNGQNCVFKCGSSFCTTDQACVRGRCAPRNCGDTACEQTEACVDGSCSERPYQCVEVARVCHASCPQERQPVCGNQGDRRREFPNRCYAECDSATDIVSGPCPDECQTNEDCSNNLVCDQNRCRPSGCDCPTGRPSEKVCGRNGKTYSSRCQLDCDNVELHYRGECIQNPCTRNDECGFGRACLPAGGALRLDNIMRCRANPNDPNCLRECRDVPSCAPGRERCLPIMGEPTLCYPIGDRAGRCLEECRPYNDESMCSAGVCAHLGSRSLMQSQRETQQNARGICLPPCTSDEDCPGQLRCIPDLQGQRVCQACACDLAPPLPICHEGLRFANTCEALCSLRPAAEWTSIEDAESCDGIDNDCNGEIDDMPPQPCEAPPGFCIQGESRCENGEWTACPEPVERQSEVCDGIDNDCDGNVDENADEVCGVDEGECTTGIRRCVGGQLGECQGQVGKKDELCDRRDNDCDGQIDEGFEARLEICDGMDNDCDGRTDEGEPLDNPAVCDGDRECMSFIGEPVLSQKCGSSTGVCDHGVQFCQVGQWSACFGDIGESEEICDGLDNDCDGATDEDTPFMVLTPNASADEIEVALGCRRDCALCPTNWDPVCGVNGVVYPNRCEARCRRVQTQEFENCLSDPDSPVVRDCRQDADCEALGCGNQICASQARDDQCYRPSDAARCFSQGGSCGCVDGQCAFGTSRQVLRCLSVNRVQPAAPNGG